jgi:hypothetical protein
MGDGGGALDPRRLAQNPRSLLGKVIAATSTSPDAPAGRSSFAGCATLGGMWFDPAMDPLWIGDVGQTRSKR